MQQKSRSDCFISSKNIKLPKQLNPRHQNNTDVKIQKKEEKARQTKGCESTAKKRTACNQNYCKGVKKKQKSVGQIFFHKKEEQKTVFLNEHTLLKQNEITLLNPTKRKNV